MAHAKIHFLLIFCTAACMVGFLVFDMSKQLAAGILGTLWVLWAALNLRQLQPTDKKNTPPPEPSQSSSNIEKELEMAKRVQQGLLSVELPNIQGVTIGKKCIPAEHIGGDFYTFIGKDMHSFVPDKSTPGITKYVDTKGNHLSVAIGDVAGHGVSSALVMALSAGLISQIGHQHTSPAKIFSLSNNAIAKYLQNSQVPYLTACFATINLASKTLTYANGGHPPILLIHKDNTIEELSSEGVFLGMYENETYQEVQHPLKAGDRIVLFTDGITETKSPSNNFYETDCLKKTLLAHQDSSVEDTVNAVFDSTAQFRENASAKDDQSLIIIEIK